MPTKRSLYERVVKPKIHLPKISNVRRSSINVQSGAGYILKSGRDEILEKSADRRKWSKKRIHEKMKYQGSYLNLVEISGNNRPRALYEKARASSTLNKHNEDLVVGNINVPYNYLYNNEISNGISFPSQRSSRDSLQEK